VGVRLPIIATLLAVPMASIAAPKPDPLKPPADHQPKQPTTHERAVARLHYARALKLHARKHLEAARKELELALETAPDPDYHYALAQLDIELDDCAAAVPELDAYLSTPHGPNATKAANDALDTCNAKLAPPPPPPPAPPPPPPPPPPAHHWYSDRITDGLVGGGVAFGIVSLLCYRAAVGDLDTADKSMTLPEHATHVDNAHSMRTYSLVFAGAGLALATAGIYRYMTHDRHSEPHHTIAVTPTSSGGMVTLSGSFR
jgi:hypothetical protein